MLQSSSFLIVSHWIQIDAILQPDPACFTQGWLLNLGDVASGLFVFVIAGHTFYAAVRGSRPSKLALYAIIASAWVFAVLLTALGPILHHKEYFASAGAWCWAAKRYETERLALHYVWVFGVEFGTILIYLAVFIHLRRTVKMVKGASAHSVSTARIDRAARLMMLYPISYVVLTLPLSAGRMWSMAHNGKSLPHIYACVAGALMASTGLVDTLLYSWTRRALLSSSESTKGGSTVGNTGNGSISGPSRRKSSVPANTLSTISEKRATSNMSPDNIKLTHTVSVDSRPLSRNALPEEREMLMKEQRLTLNAARPGFRSYHSYDPSSRREGDRAPVARLHQSVSFAPGHQEADTPSLPIALDEKANSFNIRESGSVSSEDKEGDMV